MTERRRNIPKGKTRVIGCDLFDRSDYLVGDYHKREDAFKIADEKNRARTGSMDDVYYVYDDTGKYIRGEEAVKELTGGLGISP
ncbi:MAG TPA: hypothetical protein VHD55_03565 [Candidatus Paceibacterota bacterium]|nr:hypothetical protein [Candidatus Paceibacterota bacterium]